MSSATPDHYDRTTLLLHWAVAFLVAAQWIGGQTIDWFPRGSLRVDARSLHILTGSLLTLIFLYRLFWRSSRGAALVRQPSPIENAASRTMHLTLYLGLGIILCLGVSVALIRGDSIFGLFHLPALGAWPPDQRHAFGEQIGDYHGLAANIVLALAGLHACAALGHHFLLKDDVLRRMS